MDRSLGSIAVTSWICGIIAVEISENIFKLPFKTSLPIATVVTLSTYFLQIWMAGRK